MNIAASSGEHSLPYAVTYYPERQLYSRQTPLAHLQGVTHSHTHHPHVSPPPLPPLDPPFLRFLRAYPGLIMLSLGNLRVRLRLRLRAGKHGTTHLPLAHLQGVTHSSPHHPHLPPPSIPRSLRAYPGLTIQSLGTLRVRWRAGSSGQWPFAHLGR